MVAFCLGLLSTAMGLNTTVKSDVVLNREQPSFWEVPADIIRTAGARLFETVNWGRWLSFSVKPCQIGGVQSSAGNKHGIWA